MLLLAPAFGGFVFCSIGADEPQLQQSLFNPYRSRFVVSNVAMEDSLWREIQRLDARKVQNVIEALLQCIQTRRRHLA